MFTDLCLKKYKKVEFINVPGNHDDVLGMTIGKMIRQVYSENPRVTVQVGDNPFQYVHRENVLLGFAHGHTCKLPSLPGKMADDMYKLWGNSTYRHWITGHVHHKSWIQFKEHPGCKVETVGIIPPKDAYAHGGGYGAGRGIQGLIFDKKIGYLPLRVEENVRSTD
jgi:UDP-2,3-diacylglucosamine pyrophosphatase LpxH